MHRPGFISLFVLFDAFIVASLSPVRATAETLNDPATAVAAKFFETEVQPLLGRACLRCHGAKKAKGGLRLDSRPALLEGGDSGPAFDVQKPGASLFLTAILYVDDDLQMPPKGKMSDQEIAVLRRWILDGAPWSGRIQMHMGGPARLDHPFGWWYDAKRGGGILGAIASHLVGAGMLVLSGATSARAASPATGV